MKVGDKIKLPIDKKPKSAPSWEECSANRCLPKNQDFLYISEFLGDQVVVGVNRGAVHSSFDIHDIELYNEEPQYEIY